ncbi:MAG: amidohydrolase family protein [Vicinamibacterales bacterium]|jgi:imidazolonepropionase-like amidohydrolase|nr:amidohydrolase family protein [Vicinamibacterales bacterium]MDP7672387.1 amidohydrolase family protein [Vicinamibacterales bacterium]HJO39407.1 amidohydrolase family protein [Vicinamibacterales bacterium]|tara:strand:- start:4 stop:1323 length:1320 start_codon:yes stop_codon:yes gene_type:complete
MSRLLKMLTFAVILSLAAVPARAQNPYARPSLEVLAAAAGADGILPQPFIALTGANVIDVRSGSVLGDVSIVLREGRIVSVGPEAPPAAADVIDLRGRYVTPGFFEGHYHGSSVGSAHRALVSGVTTARSASADGFSDIAQRDLVTAGYLAGPDILAASVYVTPELGTTDDVLADPRLAKYLNRPVRGEAAVREVVRINAEHGVDWIKTRTSGLSSRTSGPDALAMAFTVEELAAIMDEAERHGIPVACHAHGIEVVIAGIEAGCRSIEHASYINEEALRLMKARGTLWVPTYISVVGFELPHDDYATTIARQRAPHILENLQRMIRLGHEMGIPILTAVDTSYGPESVYRVAGEINAFIDFGMSPIDALRAATIRSAEAYGLADRTGAIEVGLEADLLVFDRNPLEQPSVLHNPLAVLSNGRVGLNRSVGSAKVLPGY